MVELYKALLISFLTALFGVLGYTFIHYEDFTTTKIIIVSSVAALLFIFIIVLLIFFLKLTKKIAKED
ncbi:hypothetical protein [Campylobacter cuniculorum]|uniref:Uncharacterized protein n=2 Tax=Campylobacter cuniculorum TaxID=374106 RepID=A0A1W6BW38_9BACT|nr:hypothetical protein [Campylobacter cuniculorum]ARJ56326.1 hypothetical protein CCUN_0706 [Campylobacter cuniculorum DSM 23162 = LMG 24588]QOR03816.1 hypothetical protein A0071_06435 [Campylobacter cuniculorum]